MNERIRELALQANGPNPFYGTLKNQMTLLGDDAVERFAELIVKECVEQASISNGHGNNQWDKALTFAADNIKKHFGVEE